MRAPVPFLIALLLVLSTQGRTEASLNITINDLNLASGASDAVTVSITSTATDSLSSFTLEFRISRNGDAPVGGLQFAAVQSIDYLSDPNYVFAGNSANLGPFPFPSSLSSFAGTNDTYETGDGTADFSNVTITGGSKLLIKLLVTSSTGTLTPQSGDSYTISLIPQSSDPNVLGGSSFSDADFNLIEFSSVSGRVRIGSGVTVVPEPSTAPLVGAGVLLWLVYAWRHRRAGAGG